MKRWDMDLDTARVLTPTIVGDGLVTAGRDNPGGHNLVVGLAADGTERWRWEPLNRGRISGFTVSEDQVLVASDEDDTAMQAIDVRTGDDLWTTPLTGQTQMISVVADETLYIGGSEAGVTALDTTSGTIRWAMPFEGLLGGGMVVTGGLLIAAIGEEGGRGRVVALADPADPRHAALASAPSRSAQPTERNSRTVAAARSPQRRRHPGAVAAARCRRGPGRDDIRRRPGGQPRYHQAPRRRDRYWGERGGGEGEFDFATVTENDASTSITLLPDGELIVVGDGNNHRVQVFDGSRGYLRSIGRLGREDRQFVNPCCVTVDAEHRIWVVDTAQAEVQVFDADGELLLTFGSPGSGDGELARPGGPFIDLDTNEVYIPDFANRRVSVFSTDGTWLRHYDRKLNDELRFDEVNGVFVDRVGRVWVLDTTNCLFVLDREGTLLHTFVLTAVSAAESESDHS